jgi:hypothetical protein
MESQEPTVRLSGVLVPGAALESNVAAELNIHEHTERGDNDAIKKGKTKGKMTDLSGASVGKCSV